MVTGAVIALCGAVVGATGKSVNQMIASGVLFGVGGGLQGAKLCSHMSQPAADVENRNGFRLPSRGKKLALQEVLNSY